TAFGYGESTVQIGQENTAVIRTRELAVYSGIEPAVPATETPEVPAETTDSAGGETAPQTEPAVTEESAVDTVSPDAASPQTESATEDSVTPDADAGEADTAASDTTGTSDEKRVIIERLSEKFGAAQEVSFQSVGPTIGKELTRKAIYSVIIASAAIILYIAWAFRHVPAPASSYRFGVCAIIALLHDVFFLLGMFAILGHFFDVEINGMFVVAVLTVMGFSVHDSIVVFDRIREMLQKEIGQPFEKIVNDSILETLGRSINTTLTVILTLLALFLFGGDSIRAFSFALLINVLSGSYSSIFNASPLLVDWQNLVDRRRTVKSR
ncbi:MAG TPA: protein translocase subunit SecF, partial [bacterium]|nr:protein translocase subunit SecF [bacterium]